MQPLLTIFVILALVFVQLHTSANALTTELIYPIPGNGIPQFAAVTIRPDVDADDRTPGAWEASARYEMLPGYVEAGLHFVRGSWNVTCQYFGGPETTRPLGDLRMSVRDISLNGIQWTFQYRRETRLKTYRVVVRAHLPIVDRSHVEICQASLPMPDVDMPTGRGYFKFFARTSQTITSPTMFYFIEPSIRMNSTGATRMEPMRFNRLREVQSPENLAGLQAEAQSYTVGYSMEHHGTRITPDGKLLSMTSPTEFTRRPTPDPGFNRRVVAASPPRSPHPSISRPSVIQRIPQGRPGKRQRSPSPSSSN